MQFNLSKASDGILLVDATKKAGEFLKLDKVYEATSPDLRVKLANVHRCLVPSKSTDSGPISSGTYIRSLGKISVRNLEREPIARGCVVLELPTGPSMKRSNF